MATKLHRLKGEQFFDSNGDPLAGGKFRYDRATTTTLLTTYSDAAGTVPNTQTDNRIILDAAGRLEEPVYIDDSFDAKETLFTSADVIVDPWPFDNIPKAVDLAASLSDTAKPRIQWTTDSAATVNLTTGNLGGGRLGDTSSNSITYNPPSASEIGNGNGFLIKKTDASNTVTFDPDGSETVDGESTFSWTEDGRAYWFISDGANWRVATWYAAPSSIGNDVLQADTGADARTAIGGILTDAVFPGAIVAIIEDQKSQNTDAQTLSTGANTRNLTALAYNRNSTVSLASNRFTLPAGTWEIAWSAPVGANNFSRRHQTYLYNFTDSTEVARGDTGSSTATSDNGMAKGISVGAAVVTIAAAKEFEIRHFANGSLGGGDAANNGTEVYTRVSVRAA